MKHPIFGTVTTVYWWNRQSTKFYVVNQGGTSSSKTYSIMQVICELLMEKRRTALVTGMYHHSLVSGAKVDLYEIIARSPILRRAMVNPDAEGEKFLFKNGSRLTFKAYDTADKAKYGKRDILFINEANNMTYAVADQLMKRARERVFIDFNSDARFWVHDNILVYDRHRADYFISNFTHNEYAPEETLEYLRGILQKKTEINNAYWNNEWDVYGLGLTGSVSGTIFQGNFHLIDDFDKVIGLRKKAYFIDFGYTNDPTAVGIAGMKFGNVYAKELLYETGHYGELLALKLKNELQLDPRIPMVCDNDRASVLSLQRAGFKAIIAKKPKVTERLTMMQEVQMFIDKRSTNFQFEQQNYKFKLNKLTMEYTNQPEDEHNHLFDGLGYYLVTVKGMKAKTKPRRAVVR
ncbi:MAG TPA: phage terminase large subunit [Tissierellaceae bacterium]|nr:phage terminase large subunit [Tissierellaceae bacterium]